MNGLPLLPTTVKGLPILSHPPPDNGSGASACRRCNKEFNFLFSRQKRCNHCGYTYCSSCADFQAMMPRTGADRGYEALPVCSFCMDMLTITASSKFRLRSLPLSILRSYMEAYDIRTSGAALEKDDLIEAILRAKGSNGCLLPVHEDYYRKHSVPLNSGRSKPRSLFSRTPRQEPPAPTPQSQHRQYPTPPSPSPGPPPPHARAAPPRYQYQQQHRPEAPSPQMSSPQQRPPRNNPASTPQSPRSYSTRPQAPSSNLGSSASQTNFHSPAAGAYPTGNEFHARQPPPRPRSAAPPAPPPSPPAPAPPAAPSVPSPSPPAPPPPVPSLDSLLQMTSDDIAHFSISTLKSILFENRVNSSFGVLEKQDLVQKVIALVDGERRDRRIKEQEEREEREEAERMEWARREREEEEGRRATERDRNLMEEHLRDRGGVRAGGEAREGTTDRTNDHMKDPNNGPRDASSRSSPSYQFFDKANDGLCVICQDEHATMAIIDCGHLALCKGCSETVMKTTRECPLCRTRIVTEQRLLRIFKT